MPGMALMSYDAPQWVAWIAWCSGRHENFPSRFVLGSNCTVEPAVVFAKRKMRRKRGPQVILVPYFWASGVESVQQTTPLQVKILPLLLQGSSGKLLLL